MHLFFFQQYYEYRTQVVKDWKAKGPINPYPHKFEVTISLAKFIEKYNSLEKGAVVEDETVSVAGEYLFL